MLVFLWQSSNVATLEDLNMMFAANFDLDETCECLAEFIDSAHALRKLDISQ